jgi:hypothetical protein
MELAAASEMSLGYRVDKQPTWHPIWRARYRVAVDCRPEVLAPRSTTRSCRGLRPRPAIRTRRGGTICRFLRLSSHLGGLTLIPTRRAYRQNSTVFVHPGRSRKSDLRASGFGEILQDASVARLRCIEDDFDPLRMSTMVAVGRVRSVAASLADASRDNAGKLADQVLHPPEASPCEYSALIHVKPPQPDRDIRRSPRSPCRRDR